MAQFVARSARNHVRVRTSRPAELAEELTRHGATVNPSGAGYREVSGLEGAVIGDIAAEHKLAIHEMSSQNVSLEDAFMELTRDSVDYHAHAPKRSP